MRSNLYDDEVRAVWQNQPTEASEMSLILIRQKGRQLRAQTRRNALGTLFGPCIVGFFYLFCIKQFPQLRGITQSLFAVALVWSLAGAFLLSRGNWPGTMAEDAAFSTGLEFCRREMKRQHDYSRHVLVWSFGPIVLALGTLILAFIFVAGPQLMMKAMPVMILAIVWIVAYLVLWAQQRRKLWREINELGEFDK